LSALVSSGAVSFNAAVESATKFGLRWDQSIREMSNGKTDDEVGWSQFRRVRRMMEGVSPLSLTVERKELPVPEAPAKPVWSSTSDNGEAVLITTAQEAMAALETLNIASWSYLPGSVANSEEPVRGWLVSPLHPTAKLCRWSVSNYLLATPSSVTLFLDHIATLARNPVVQSSPESAAQNRLRLSRMKVTGP
jgi:hypothetical protein